MSTKHAVLTLAALGGLSTLARRATERQLRILCYHGLWLAPGPVFGNCLFMAPDQFEARMARLVRSGRPVLPLGEAVARLAADDLPPAAVVITIDDGWASTHSHMLPILEHYGLPATLYATTWYSGRDLPVINVAVDYIIAMADSRVSRARVIREIEGLPQEQRLDALCAFGRSLGVGDSWLDLRQFHLMTPAQLAEANDRGLDIQLHSHRHIDVASGIGRLGQEVEENRAFLARATGASPATHFCYPSGTWHPAAPTLLSESGVESATLVTEGLNAPGANPYALRRFVDGRSVTQAEFDAYLSGTLHYLNAAREAAHSIHIEGIRRAAAASGMLLAAI